jgi:hypothetical protein
MKFLHLGKLAFIAMLIGSSAIAHAQKPEHFTTLVRSSDDASIVSGVDNLSAKELISAGDQPMLRFIAFEKGKPFASVTDPRLGAFYLLDFGVHNVVLDKIVPFKKPSDLKNIVPIRHQAKFDCAKQMDKKFKGFRKLESPLGAVVEDAFSMLGLVTMKDYQGTFFKDEYNSGMPMVITLETVTLLRNLQEYFIKNQIEPRAVKPWLVLEIMKNPEAVSEADKAFWSSYFELVPRSAPGMEARLRFERDLRYQIYPIGCKGKFIFHTIPEVLLLRFERFFEDLKTPEVSFLIASLAGAFLWKMIDANAVQPAIKGLTHQKDDKGNFVMKPGVKSGFETALTIGKYTAAAVVAFALYRLWVNTVDTIASDEELDEEAHHVEAFSA